MLQMIVVYSKPWLIRIRFDQRFYLV